MRKTVVAVVAVLLLVAGCSFSKSRDEGGRGGRSLTDSELEALTRISLPADAVVLASHYEAFQDWQVLAKISLPSNSLDEFLADSRFPEATPDLRPFGNTAGPGKDFWTPDSAVTVLGVDQVSDPVEGVYRRLVIDLDTPSEATVYLVAFTT